MDIIDAKRPEDLTPECCEFLFKLLRDSDNWAGNPMIGGNVTIGPKEKGFLTDLKKKDYLSTFESDGFWFVQWTQKSGLLAQDFDISLGLPKN